MGLSEKPKVQDVKRQLRVVGGAGGAKLASRLGRLSSVRNIAVHDLSLPGEISAVLAGSSTDGYEQEAFGEVVVEGLELGEPLLLVDVPIAQ